MKTKLELENDLRTAGLGAAAIEAVVRLTARARHTWRVEKAAKAAFDAVADLSSADRCMGGGLSGLAALRWAILAADQIGVGGPQDAGASADGRCAESTDRIPALSGLGKGRKHASDGGAWSAAIYAASQSLQVGSREGEHEDRHWTFSVDIDGDLLVAASGEPIPADGGGYWPRCISVPESIVPRRWQRAIAAQAMVACATGTCRYDMDPEVPVAQWARLFDRCE